MQRTDQYVANYANGSNNVTVINGATNAATSVPAGSQPTAIAVNPVTNTIYSVNYGSNNVTVIDGEQNATAAVDVGAAASDVAANPQTNMIYVANSGSNTVTAINGVTNATATVNVGTTPEAITVNPVTNMIYVANNDDGTVTVINGATNATVTVPVGANPTAIVVNLVTNMIYVPSLSSNNVTVINGATNATTTITVPNAGAIAVNPATNLIYVVSEGFSGSVTVINGATNATTSVPVGSFPDAIAVNPVTNTIYVANSGNGGSVTVINGATTATTSVSAGFKPTAIAVNPVANMIYLASPTLNHVTVINGVTGATSNVTVGTSLAALTVNPVTNKIYAANSGSGTVTEIDGATNTTQTITVGTTPVALALNPLTNQVYVANNASGNVTVITPGPVGSSNLFTAITPLAGNVSYSATPTFALQATSLYGPTAPPVQEIWYQVDTMTGPWQLLSVVDGAASASLNSLMYGPHTIFAFATDGQEATSVMLASSPVIGKISAYSFIYGDTTPVAVPPAVSLVRGTSAPVTLAGSGSSAITYTLLTQPTQGTLTGTASNLTYTTNNATYIGADSFTYLVGDGLENSAAVTVSIQIIDQVPVATGQNLATSRATPVAFTLSGTGLNALTYTVATPPANGQITGSGTALTYTPNAAFAGNDSFTFTANDGIESSAPATVTIAVVEIAPTAAAQTVSVASGGAVAVTLAGLGSSSLTYNITTPPAHGTLSGTAPGLTYTTSNATFVGADSFAFTVNDGVETSAPATVSVAVVAVGSLAATAQSVSVERGAKATITLSGSSPRALTYTVGTPPAHGTLSGTVPNLSYAAGAIYAGSDSFTFTVSDGVNISAPATVSITVLDSPPMAVNDVYYTASSLLTPFTLPVLANDTDPEGRALTITAVTRAGEGKVSVAANQLSLIYQPEVSFATSGLADTFTYTVSNGDKTATAQVTVLNPFYHRQGNFDGLVTAGTTNAGYLALTLGSAGTFTGSLNVDGAVSAFHGTFSSSGAASVSIARKSPLLLQLQFNEAAGASITVSFLDGVNSYAGTLESQVAVSALNSVAQAGHYTVIIPPPAPLTGTAATATATVTGGEVSGLNLTGGGLGYVTAPLVAISGAGSGATAVAIVNTATGKVTGLTLLTPGSKYGTSPVTVTINPPADSLPGGTGWGALTVGATGVVSVTGQLGDGTAFSCSAYLKADGTFPMYVPLNATTTLGALFGTGAFQNIPNTSDLSAGLTWHKAAQAKAGLYQAGFNTQVTLLGSYYLVMKGASALAFSSVTTPIGTVGLSGGNLSPEINDSISVSTANVVKELGLGADHLKLTINGTTGLITGSFLSTTTSTITGAVFQKQNLAAGLFTRVNLTGNFTLDPQ